MLLSILFILNNFGNGFNHYTVTSRVAYALARDNAFPLSGWIKKLNRDTKNPDNANAFVFFVESFLLVIYILNSDVYDNLTSLCAIGVHSSWLIPISLRFYKQCSGAQLPVGKFSLGRYSMIAGFISASWLLITCFAFMIPPYYDPVNGITV